VVSGFGLGEGFLSLYVSHHLRDVRRWWAWSAASG